MNHGTSYSLCPHINLSSLLPFTPHQHILGNCSSFFKSTLSENGTTYPPMSCPRQTWALFLSSLSSFHTPIQIYQYISGIHWLHCTLNDTYYLRPLSSPSNALMPAKYCIVILYYRPWSSNHLPQYRHGNIPKDQIWLWSLKAYHKVPTVVRIES